MTLDDCVEEALHKAYLERVADHAVIVGQRVSYMLTGDPSALAAESG